MSEQGDLLCVLHGIGTEPELAAFLRRLSRHFDFTGFMLFSIPGLTEDNLLPRIELSDLPAGMVEGYDELGLLRNSQIFRTLRRSTAPFTIDTLTFHDTRPTEEALAAARFFASYNIRTAAFFPVHGSGGTRAVFGFLGDRNQLTHAEMGELGVFTAHAFSVYSKLKSASREADGGLTPRELEAIHWVANGKTSGEIASILSLSEHTVNTYVNNAIRKLDCVNRTHLVAKSLRLGLIH